MKHSLLKALMATLPLSLLSSCSSYTEISFEEWIKLANSNYSLSLVFDKYESATLEFYEDYADYVASAEYEKTSTISRDDFSGYVFTPTHVLTLQSSAENYSAYDSFSYSILEDNGEVNFSYEVGLDYALANYGEEIKQYSESCTYKLGDDGRVLYAKIDQDIQTDEYHFYTHAIMNISWVNDESYTSSEQIDDDRVTFEEWISIASSDYSLESVYAKYDYVDVDYSVYLSMYGMASEEKQNYQENEFESYVLTVEDIEDYQQQYMQLAANYEDVSLDILNIAQVITFTLTTGLDVGQATYGDDVTYYECTMKMVFGRNGEYLYAEEELTTSTSTLTLYVNVSGVFTWHEIDS